MSRFVQELGYSGYKSFQMDLVRANRVSSDETPENTNTGVFGYRDVAIHDSATEICRKVFLSNIKALEDTLEMIDFSVMEKIVQHIGKGGNFYIFASGRSFVAAESICKRLMRLGHSLRNLQRPARAGFGINPDQTR